MDAEDSVAVEKIMGACVSTAPLLLVVVPHAALAASSTKNMGRYLFMGYFTNR